jgi:Replication-relaxation
LTTEQLPSGYSGTTRLLARRLKSKLIKRKSLDPNKPIFWHLPKTKALNLHNWQHEKICGDLYVSLETTGLLQRWTYEPHPEYLELGLKPDRVCIFNEKIVFIEVDTGTEVLRVLQDKAFKYKQLASRHRDRKFYVLFVVSGKRRLENVCSILPQDRGFMFLAMLSSDLVNPLGQVLRPAIRVEKVSFDDLH